MSLRSQPWVAFDDPLHEVRGLAFLPAFASMAHAVWDRSAIGRSAAFLRPRDADELTFRRILDQPDVSFFEHQLLELERTYRYAVFASVRMLVEGVIRKNSVRGKVSRILSRRRGSRYLMFELSRWTR